MLHRVSPQKRNMVQRFAAHLREIFGQAARGLLTALPQIKLTWNKHKPRYSQQPRNPLEPFWNLPESWPKPHQSLGKNYQSFQPQLDPAPQTAKARRCVDFGGVSFWGTPFLG